MPFVSSPSEVDEAKLEAELIERIYNVAISPHAYDDFMDKWAVYVGQALKDLLALKREVEADATLPDETLSRHFDMGFRLLEELGRSPPTADKGDAGQGPGAASLLINQDGSIVWYNGAASRYFGLRRISRVDELPLWDRSRDELGRMIAGLSASAEDGTDKTVLRMFSKAADKTLFMLGERVGNGDGEPLILINQIVSNWHESVGRMLSASFGLSGAELEVAEWLGRGAGPAEIAELRSSALNTVRTQIKSLLSKTGVGSQTELVRLLVSLNGAAEDRSGTAARYVRRGHTFRFRQRDGRMVPYHRFGPEGGKPFVLFHGMLDGCDLTEAATDLLDAHNIALFVPERPYFGSAAGVDGDIKTAPDRFACDVEDLLDHLGLQRVGLVGHMAGSVYAFAAAALLGARVTSIVSVAGGVPIVSADQFTPMSSRQRLVAYTARYTPKLLPFVLRAGIRQLDFGGEENFMRALYENAPADLDAIADDEIADIVASGYHFTIAQGHRAFEIDSYQVVRDWSARVAQSQAPVVLIHGRLDPVVSAGSVEEFAHRLGNRARLIIDDDAGQLLLYSNPDLVINTLVEPG